MDDAHDHHADIADFYVDALTEALAPVRASVWANPVKENGSVWRFSAAADMRVFLSFDVCVSSDPHRSWTVVDALCRPEGAHLVQLRRRALPAYVVRE